MRISSNDVPCESGPQVGEVHAADLFLATAAIEGDAHALQTLAALCRRVARAATHAPGELDEVSQQMLGYLLVRRPRQTARLARYDGRGSLSSWLRAVASGIAIDLRRKEKAFHRTPLDEHDVEALGLAFCCGDPTLSGQREHFHKHFKDSFEKTLLELTPRELTLLRLRHLEGSSDEDIAVLYRVDRRTVARWRAGVRAALLEGTQRRLTDLLQISPSEQGEWFALVASQLDISFERVLLGASRERQP